MNHFPNLSTLIVFMTPQLPCQAMFSILENAVSSLSSRLTKFVTNYPWVSEVSQMSSLQSLTIDLSDVGASHRLQSYGGYSIGSYPSLRDHRRPTSPHDKFASRHMGSDPWIFPASECLLELIILTHYITLPDEIKINLDAGKRLSNLKSLKLRAPFKRMVSADLARITPRLEELDLDLESDCDRITVPPSITKLTFALRRASQPAFPIAASDLPNLTDLTIRHAEPHFPRAWWSAERIPRTAELVFEPILSMKRLNRLTILSSEFIDRTEAYTNLFEQMSSTPGKPLLEFLDVYLGRFPPSFIKLIHSSFPFTEIRYNPGVYQPQALDESSCSEMPENDGNEMDPVDLRSAVAKNIACQFCKVSIKETLLQDHLEVCAEVPKKCPLNCPFFGNRLQMHQHLLECPFYDVKCFECERIMTRAQWNNHILHHDRLATKLPPELLRCPLRQTPEWLETKCHACCQTFPTLLATQSHVCCEKGRRVLLPRPPTIGRASPTQHHAVRS